MNPAPDIPIVTIDGPSGAGKGTVAQRLADRLGWGFMDSGVFYRALALVALDRHLDLDDEDALGARAGHLDVQFVKQADAYQVQVEGKRVGVELRTERCGLVASRVAAMPKVREALLACQRSFRQAPGLVADGRDMGTVVFPDARCKVFLTASPEERARRRYQQLLDQGETVRLAGLLREIEARDQRDRNRRASPLVPAADATIIDSTGQGIEAAFGAVLAIVSRRYPELVQEHAE